MKKTLVTFFFCQFLTLPLFPHRAIGQMFRPSVQPALYYARNCTGVAAADFNNDGWIDCYLVTESPFNPERRGTANLLLKNNGDGTFTDVAAEAGLVGMDNASVEPNITINYGASWGDYDNDGFVDIYLTNKGPDELYRNLGDGTFKNVTAEAGLLTTIRESTSAVWFDWDRDGDADLFVSAYGEYGLESTQDNVLYRNNGDGTFTDITAETGLADGGYTYTTLVVDANFDGWPDLYCVNDFGANRFYLNNGDGTYREATQQYGLDDEGHGMGATLGDYDNDGRFDIYFTNIADGNEFQSEEWNPLFRHLSSGNYEDVAKRAGAEFAGWGWGVEFFDFDLDGHLDIYAVNGFAGAQTHNYMYHSNGNGTFREISYESGLGSEAEARGLCVADFNENGRLDVAIANYRQSSAIYINHTETGNFLKVNLIGTRSTRDAWGAVVIAQAGSRSYYRCNDGVEFFGQSKTPLHFGLGGGNVVHRLTVKWPSGTVDVFQNIPANQTLTITEDVGITTSIRDAAENRPATFTLLENFPNPARTKTMLQFRLKEAATIRLEIYDLLGRLQAVPAAGHFAAGEHAVAWNMHGSHGLRLPSGIYVQRLISGTAISQRKLIVVK